MSKKEDNCKKSSFGIVQKLAHNILYTD